MIPFPVPTESRDAAPQRYRRPLAAAFLLAATLATVLVAASSRTIPASAAGTGAMLVTPGAQIAPQGTNVTVGIDAGGVSALGAYEFTIQYDPSLLSFVGLTNGGFIGSTGRSTFCPPPILDTMAGTVRFGCATTGLLPPGPTGSGRLANLTFFTLAEGTSPLTFTLADMADVFGDSFTSVGATGGSITIFGGTPPPTFTTTATFTPTVTPTPIGSATPTPTGIVPPGDCGPAIEIAVCFDPSNVGATVNAPVSIDVRVEDVTNLGAFEIIANFNPALVTPVNAAPAAFLGSTGRSVQCLTPVLGIGTLRLQCVTLGATPSGPSGSGSIATLAFLPVGEGLANLTFSLATLLDPEANVIVGGFADTGSITIGPELTATPCPGACPTATPTATATNTPTPTATPSATVTPTPTHTPTPCGGPCPTPTATTPATATPTSAPVTLSVAPVAQTAATGDVFAVAVEVDGAVNLGAFQVRLTYDSAIIQKGAPMTGPFLASSGRSVQCLTPSLPPGQVQYNCVTIGVTPAGPSGSGVLALFPFTALAPGASTLAIGNAALTTPPGALIPVGSIVDGAVGVVPAATPTPCGGPCPTATATSTSTPSPTVSGVAVAVINPVQQFAPIGTIVEVSVDVAGVANLGAYQFTMRYDNAKLALVDVINAEFLASTGRSVFCPPPLNDTQNVRFGCATTGGSPPGPTGDGTLSRVRFQTIANGPADLRLTVLDLADPFSETIARTIVTNPDEIIVGTPPTATLTMTPTITPTPSPVPTSTPCPPVSDCDGFDDIPPTLHYGPANMNAAADNCIGVANPAQENADGNYTNLAPHKAFNDLTWPNSDGSGDACDSDDDNDGRSDVDELAGLGCGVFTTPTDSLVRDSDGDRVLDGAECLYGTDPNVTSSLPGACTVAGDADADGVSSAREFCFYNTDPNVANTDGDTCSDGKEVASINADTTVNAIDLSQVAQSFGPSTGPFYIVDFDITKDGNINATDLSQVAQRFGPC